MKTILLLTLTIFTLSGYAQQGHTVRQGGSGDFTSIQAAIDGASAGDTIRVYTGEYLEPLTIDKKLFIIGMSGRDMTRITGNITYSGSSTQGGIFTGFTVFGYLNNYNSVDIGNISIISNCEIHGVVKIRRTYIYDSHISVEDGNALIAYNNSIIKGNVIINGYSTASGDSILYIGNKISGSSYGITINGSYQDINIFANSISDVYNGIRFYGSGNTSHTLVSNNVFESVNRVFYFDNNSNTIVIASINNNVINNTSDKLFYLSQSVGSASVITIRNNIFSNYESTGAISGLYEKYFNNLYSGAGHTTQYGNLFNTDPLFTDPENGDYTLQSGSPAIDAGDPAFFYQDLDLTRNDMGIYGGPYSFDQYQNADMQTIQMILSSVSVQAGEDITIKATGLIWGNKAVRLALTALRFFT
ncbi:MAG: hypothetical protein RIC03_06140 [Cyclobacteriaceae bacterium]